MIMLPHGTVVHGWPLRDLIGAVVPESAALTSVPAIVGVLGGWSNVNVLLETGAGQRLVLKVPAVRDVTVAHYEMLAARYRALASRDLMPSPIEVGCLGELTIPYLLLEYVDGEVYSSPSAMPPDRLVFLRDALARLWDSRVGDAPVFRSSIDYLVHLIGTLEQCDGPELFSELVPAVSYSDTIDRIRDVCLSMHWSQALIHGDLSESNIVFTEGRVWLLDPEALCFADPRLDIAYLSVQHEHEGPTEMIRHLFDSPELRPESGHTVLALLSCITWSVQRIVDIDRGRVTEHLATGDVRQRIGAYVRQKMGLLALELDAGS